MDTFGSSLHHSLDKQWDILTAKFTTLLTVEMMTYVFSSWLQYCVLWTFWLKAYILQYHWPVKHAGTQQRPQSIIFMWNALTQRQTSQILSQQKGKFHWILDIWILYKIVLQSYLCLMFQYYSISDRWFVIMAMPLILVNIFLNLWIYL